MHALLGLQGISCRRGAHDLQEPTGAGGEGGAAGTWRDLAAASEAAGPVCAQAAGLDCAQQPDLHLEV